MMACCQPLARSARSGRPLGDSGASHPLGGSEVGHRARRAGDGHGDVALQRAVPRRVVWGVVAPALPHHPAPGASEGADRARVFVAALAGLGVEVLGPGMPVAAAVRQPAERDAQALVARPSEPGRFPFAGLVGDGGLAGVGGERVAVGVSAVGGRRSPPVAPRR